MKINDVSMPSNRMKVWCPWCKQMVWIRAKNIQDVLNEGMFHQVGFCFDKKMRRKR